LRTFAPNNPADCRDLEERYRRLAQEAAALRERTGRLEEIIDGAQATIRSWEQDIGELERLTTPKIIDPEIDLDEARLRRWTRTLLRILRRANIVFTIVDVASAAEAEAARSASIVQLERHIETHRRQIATYNAMRREADGKLARTRIRMREFERVHRLAGCTAELNRRYA